MIKESLQLKDNLVLQIVDKDDITASYKNNRLVSSCMSEQGRWKYTRLYNYIEDLTLLRIMQDKDLVLRALIWSVTTDDGSKFKYVDKVYDKDYPHCTSNCDFWCEGHQQEQANPLAYEAFKDHWPKYADVRNTNKTMYAKVLPNKIRIWPYIDTFLFYNKDKQLLSNKSDYSDNPDNYVYKDLEFYFVNALDHV